MKSSAFHKHTLIASFSIFFLSCLWFGYLVQKASVKEEILPTVGIDSQIRTRVQKDIWISNSPTERLHNRIESDQSRLVLQTKDNALDIVEHLYGVRCIAQEKIKASTTGNSQQLRFFLAKEGLYHYRNHHFHAFDVLLSLHKLPGSDLPLELHSAPYFLKGTAQEVSFFIENGKSFFEATHFVASSKGTSS